MATWSEFEAAAPRLAQTVRERFEAHTHKTIATLRRDGAPRISGTEARFADGELWIGSMWEAVKALDLRRDPRYALHSGSDDPPGWQGDAKVAGRAEEILDQELVERHNGEAAEHGPSHLFRLEIESASSVAINDAGDALEIESWNPADGVRRLTRA
jgi:hypothetical protein